MTHLAYHPHIFLSEWNDTLGAIRGALEAHPEALTLTFIFGGKNVPETVIAHLLEALENERVTAAEACAISPHVVNYLKPSQRVSVVTRVTQPISVFKVDALRNFLPELEKELGDSASPSDISVVLNRSGYSTVRVLVPQNELAFVSDTIQSVTREWDSYITHVENDWQNFNQSPFTHFSAALSSTRIVRVLIDASGLEPKMNGTARNALSFLDTLNRQLTDEVINWEVTAIVPQESVTFFNHSWKKIQVVSTSESLMPIFHLGLTITPITSIGHCLWINQLCVRWVVQHLDIIALRALPFLSQNTESLRATKLYLENADEVVFISEAAKADVLNFFNLRVKQIAPHVVLHLGNTLQAISQETAPSLTEPYVVVVGNDYPHKQVDAAIDALSLAGYRVRSLGSGPSRSSHHLPIPPGSLSNEEMSTLIAESSVVVFPSLYEGYGLPIAEAAAAGKQVVLWDTAVSREVSRSIGTENLNYFCTSMDEVVEAVAHSMSNPILVDRPVRSLTDFNLDLIHTMHDLLEKKLDSSRIISRWNLFNLLAASREQVIQETISYISQHHWRSRLKRKFRKNVR